MKFCEKCGIKLEENASYCINCRNISLVENGTESLDSPTDTSINHANFKTDYQSENKNPSIENQSESFNTEKLEPKKNTFLCTVIVGIATSTPR